MRRTARHDGRAALLRADGDGDGLVDPGDYGVWRTNFGETLPSGAGGGEQLGSGVIAENPPQGIAAGSGAAAIALSRWILELGKARPASAPRDDGGCRNGPGHRKRCKLGDARGSLRATRLSHHVHNSGSTLSESLSPPAISCCFYWQGPDRTLPAARLLCDE